jgi:hypothetical protein
MTIRPGQEWGSPATEPPDRDVSGGDADLAGALAGAPPGVLVRYRPSAASDLARALGLSPTPGEVAVPLDVLRLLGRSRPQERVGGLAVNAVVLGVAPDQLRWWHRRVGLEVTVDGRPAFAGRATTVAVLNGQYLRGADLSPRGHPGDGSAEVQVYALAGSQRGGMRRRLRTGSHLPHPDIATRRAKRVAVRFSRPVLMEVDGRPAGRTASLELEVLNAAYRLLI